MFDSDGQLFIDNDVHEGVHLLNHVPIRFLFLRINNDPFRQATLNEIGTRETIVATSDNCQ